MTKINSKCNVRSKFLAPTHYNITESENFCNKCGYILDTSCKNWESVLKTTTKLKFIRQRYWILICKSSNMLHVIYSTLQTIPLRLDSDVFIAVRHYGSYLIFEAYNPGYTSGGNVLMANTINYTQGEFVANNMSWYNRRKDLSSIKLRVGIVITKNTSMTLHDLKDEQNKYDDVLPKTSFGMFQHIPEIHKFRWSKVVTSGWFGPTRHGIDTGMAKILNDEEADISAAAGLMTPGRVEKIDYLVGIYVFGTCFIFRNRGDYGYIQNIFIKPFSSGCWLCAILLSILLCMLLRLVYLTEEYLHESPSECTWVTSIIYTMSAFCQQGVPLESRYVGGRVLILSLLTLSYLLYNYYTSSIVSGLITGKKSSLATLNDLVHSNLDIGVEDISYMRRLLKATEDPALLYLGQQLKSHSSRAVYYSPQKGAAKVREGGFAYHSERSTQYRFILDTFDDSQICDVEEIDVYPPQTVYMLAQKYGQYNKLFLISYRKMVEAGLLHRQQHVWLTTKPRCRSSHFVQVGIEQAASALLVLSLGILAALFVFIIEKFYNFKRHIK